VAQARINESALQVKSGAHLEGKGLSLRRLRILYVTDRVDAPFRYRCVHPVLLLREEGVAAEIRHLSEVTVEEVGAFSAIVLFRLPWTEKVEAIVESARSAGTAIVFDIDDLIFDPEKIGELPFWDSVSKGDQNRYLDLSNRLSRTFDAADYFLGATPALARAAERRGKIAAVHPNLMHPYLARTSRFIAAARRYYARQPIISYMSGSATHDLDFMKIAPAIRRVLEKNTDARLMVCGFLDLRRLFGIHDRRVIRLPFIDWTVLPWVQSIAWVNLSPLSQLDEFTDSKSALKFFEAAAAGVPTVASPSGPMKDAISHEHSGFLAESSSEWIEAVGRCLSRSESEKIGIAARAAALEHHSFKSQRGQLSAWLSRICSTDWEPRSKSVVRNHLEPETVDPKLRANGGRMRQKLARIRSVVGVITKAGTPEKIVPMDIGMNTPEHWTAVDASVEELLSHAAISSLELAPPDSRLSKDDPNGWEVAWEAEANRDDPGGWVSFGTDPCLLSPELSIDGAAYRFLWIEMRAEVEGGSSTAQLYWLTDDRPTYGETRSCPFPVIADGKLHGYLVDLQRTVTGASDAGAWSDSKKIRRLRFDPLRQPGTFHVRRIVLLGERLMSDSQMWERAGLRPIAAELSSAYLAGEGIKIGTASYDTPRPSTAEFLSSQSAQSLLPATLDFCLLESGSEAELRNDLSAAFAALRPEGILMAIWERPTGGSQPPPSLPGKVLEWIVQSFGGHFRCMLVLRR